jgi:hypothetical protein
MLTETLASYPASSYYNEVKTDTDELPSVAFNISKKELFTPTQGLKNLFKRLRSKYRPQV